MSKSENKIAVYARTNMKCVESINHQINLILSYIEKKEMKELSGIYADCGFSAIDKSRPEYNRLIDDVRKGIINTIIVSELSRLNRNILQFDNDFGKYIIKNQVNIIGIQDGYTSKENNIYKQLIDVLNKEYKRKISEKRKEINKSKTKNSNKKEV